jgi:hypothetical protein
MIRQAGVFALILTLGLSGTSSQAQTTSPVDSIIELVQAGMSESTILNQLRSEGNPIALTPADLLKLQNAHVPESIITVMMEPAPQPALQTQIAPVPVPPPPAAAPRHLSLSMGTQIAIRTIDPIDSKRKKSLDEEFAASLDGPLFIDGVQALPAGTSAFLQIAKTKSAGVFNGSASLSLRLVAIVIDGRRIHLETAEFISQSEGKGADSAERVGIGAGAGAIVGTLTGLGAWTGAAIGGGVGAGAAILNRPVVKVPSETRLTFTLRQPAAIN